MADEPVNAVAGSSEGGQPAPQVLQPKSEAVTGDTGGQPVMPTASGSAGVAGSGGKRPKWMKRGGYQPTHKATFVGLAVVAAILAVNAVVIGFVIKGQDATKSEADRSGVTLSQDTLDKVGINRTAIGNSGIELVVNPNAKFNGKLQVGGDVNVAGQLKLNSKLSAADANVAKLEAGDTSLSQLNVNGNGTISTLNLRNDLIIAGTSRLQGEVIVSKLMTVNNNMNVAGNLAVGGTLTVRSFQTTSLVVESGLTVGGHVITRGLTPGLTPGPSLGSNGTVSISGNDAAGTVAVNIGAGGTGAGIVASVSFRSAYGTVPRVIVTAVGAGIRNVYVNRSASGFSIGVNDGIPNPGGYAFDYIVIQ